jgi:hypothetical protein
MRAVGVLALRLGQEGRRAFRRDKETVQLSASSLSFPQRISVSVVGATKEVAFYVNPEHQLVKSPLVMRTEIF